MKNTIKKIDFIITTLLVIGFVAYYFKAATIFFAQNLIF